MKAATIVDITTKEVVVDRPQYEEFRFKRSQRVVPSERLYDALAWSREEEFERRVYEGICFRTSEGQEKWVFFDVKDVMSRLPWLEALITKRVEEETLEAKEEMWKARSQARERWLLILSWEGSKLFKVYRFFYNVRQQMNRL